MINYRVERLKEALRTGGLVVSDRRTGKTTALLQLIHEEGSAHVIVVCPNALHAANVQSLWEKLYPEERRIRFQLHGDAGSEERVYVDEWYYCKWRGDFDRAISSFPFPIVNFGKGGHHAL